MNAEIGIAYLDGIFPIRVASMLSLILTCRQSAICWQMPHAELHTPSPTDL